MVIEEKDKNIKTLQGKLVEFRERPVVDTELKQKELDGLKIKKRAAMMLMCQVNFLILRIVGMCKNLTFDDPSATRLACQLESLISMAKYGMLTKEEIEEVSIVIESLKDVVEFTHDHFDLISKALYHFSSSSSDDASSAYQRMILIGKEAFLSAMALTGKAPTDQLSLEVSTCLLLLTLSL